MPGAKQQVLAQLRGLGWMNNALDEWSCPKCSKLAPPKPIQNPKAPHAHTETLPCPNCGDGELFHVNGALRCNCCHYAEQGT